MLELKLSSEAIEAKLYEFHRRMLEQLRSCYSERQQKLKANLLEYTRQEEMISFHEQHMRHVSQDAEQISFLHHW